MNENDNNKNSNTKHICQKDKAYPLINPAIICIDLLLIIYIYIYIYRCFFSIK